MEAEPSELQRLVLAAVGPSIDRTVLASPSRSPPEEEPRRLLADFDPRWIVDTLLAVAAAFVPGEVMLEVAPAYLSRVEAAETWPVSCPRPGGSASPAGCDVPCSCQ